MNPQKKKLLKELHTESTPEWKAALEKEWPWLSDPALMVGKWYKPFICGLINYQGNDRGYGFWRDDWRDSLSISCTEYPLATESEVSTALINEAKKRGYNGNNAESLIGLTLRLVGGIYFKFYQDANSLYIFGPNGFANCIFDNGT